MAAGLSPYLLRRKNGDDRETGSARANKPQLVLIMDSIESMYIQ